VIGNGHDNTISYFAAILFVYWVSDKLPSDAQAAL